MWSSEEEHWRPPSLMRMCEALYHELRERYGLPACLAIDAIRQARWIADGWLANPSKGRGLNDEKLINHRVPILAGQRVAGWMLIGILIYISAALATGAAVAVGMAMLSEYIHKEESLMAKLRLKLATLFGLLIALVLGVAGIIATFLAA